MFKKRGVSSKKIDINIQAENINLTSIENPLHLLQSRQKVNNEDNIFEQKSQLMKNKYKNNTITLQSLQKTQISQNRKIKQIQKIQNYQIDECFAEIKKYKEQIQHTEQNQLKVMQDVILTDDKLVSIEKKQENQEYLHVEEDIDGGFSPMQDSNDQMAEEDYEDMLIRKTLTKNNYQKVAEHSGQKNLTALKKQKYNDNLLKNLKQIDSQGIKKSIARDLHNKKIKQKQLTEQYEYLQKKFSKKNTQIQQKVKQVENLKLKFQELNKVIQFIYYYGEKVNQFDIKSILNQAQQKLKPIVWK